jgi:Cyclophilin type peptidyl-prolyl cis-trans isomerase/CLD
MKYLTLLVCLTFVSIYFSACGGSESAPTGTNVVMKTDKGNIYIKLFDDTPKHKENFLKLAKEGFFNGIEFHRVIPNFMVQAGKTMMQAIKLRQKLCLHISI